MAALGMVNLAFAGGPDRPEYKTIPAASPAELTPAPAAIPGSGRDWMRSHGDNAGSRYSELKQIHRGNVKSLAVAWTYRSGDGQGHLQCNLVIMNGVIYAPTAGEFMVAIDGANGREIWRYKPQGRPAHRGLLYWPGDRNHAPRLYFSAGDWLYALDAASGKPAAEFGDNGRVPAKAVVAPAVYKQTLLIPCWNVVRAFDVLSGKPAWTFHPIPQAGEFGRESWMGAEPFAGASCWGGMALDSRRGIAYISTGSPHPNFVGMNHRGDNLFANCVIALDAGNGRRLWHFQEIHHDIWDLDIPAPPNLVTVLRGGRKYDAVAQVTKIGNTLLLDRLTGKPLFPYRERRAPAAVIDTEQTSEWQPALELPEPFARQGYTPLDLTDISPRSRNFILDRIAGTDSGWFTPFQDGRTLVFYGMHGGAEWTGAAFEPTTGKLYVSSNELPWMGTVRRVNPLRARDAAAPLTAGMKTYREYCSECHGLNRQGLGTAPPVQLLSDRFRDEQVIEIIKRGRNSMPAVLVPDNAMQPMLDYLNDRDLPPSSPADGKSGPPTYRLVSHGKLLDQDGRPGVKPPWGTLNAIDLNSGRIAWKVPLGEYEELTRAGIPKTGTENFGGAMVTAGGLVFCAGTRDLKIRAFDSRDGTELWEYKLPFGGFAPPAAYETGGRQFIVIAATGGGKLGGPMGDAYVAFALPHSKPGSR